MTARSSLRSFERVPMDMVICRQWVDYRLFKRWDRSLVKLPVDPVTGWYSSPSDPSTWSSFDAAVRRYQTDSTIDGIGFVFTQADSYVCIDFAHCRSGRSGKIAGPVRGWIARLDSYTEVSASGTGIHVIVKASLPKYPCRTNGIELASQAGFIGVTGRHLAYTPIRIETRQAQMDALLLWSACRPGVCRRRRTTSLTSDRFSL